MAAYLTDRRPKIAQWYAKRNRPLTGCTVLHTSEGVLDSVGPDTGAEGLAEFIRGRTTAGSYHDIADSDSWIHLIEYGHGAFHDGTGSNNWALSLSFACRTTDWKTMGAAKRAGFLRQGARAFLEQQAYRRSVGAPLTELRLITKAQSDRGESGFTYHGYRDPGRRTDPGTTAANPFPFDEFIAAIRAEQAGAPLPTPVDELEALMAGIYDPAITTQSGRQLSLAGALTLVANFVEARAAVAADGMKIHDGYGAAVATDNFGTPQQKTIRERDILGELRAMAAKQDAMLRLVAEQNGLSLDDVRRVFREELDKGLDVDVTVAAGPGAAPTSA